METATQINFPKLEQQQFEFDHQWMFLGDHLQRSLQVPLFPTIPSSVTNYWTSNLPNNSLIEYPQTFLTQQNFINDEIIAQTMDNNNNLGEADFHLWNECPPLCEDAWMPLSQLPPTTIPCTFDNPKPISFDQNESNDQIFLFNNPNLNDYSNDQPLNMFVEEGINMSSMQENLLEDDNYTIREFKHNVKVPKVESIQYEEIRKYFDMPISRAAKELNVGLTVLKKRCRELNIKRWPHRKIKSLESLISNVKDLGMMEVVQVLEEHKRKLHYVPGLELTEETKKLRQACFKANYKKRRALALTHH